MKNKISKLDEKNITFLEEIKTVYVKSGSGINRAKKAFNELEIKLKSIKGRKMYGIYWQGDYYACSKIKPIDNLQRLELDTYIIPAGKYAKLIMCDWFDKLHLIASAFDQIKKENAYDRSRPEIEYYERFNKLILYLPII